LPTSCQPAQNVVRACETPRSVGSATVDSSRAYVSARVDANAALPVSERTRASRKMSPSRATLVTRTPEPVVRPPENSDGAVCGSIAVRSARWRV
jgi:hypothetical protein